MFLLISIVSGIAKVFRYWQVVFLFVLVQLFFAWIFAVPLNSALHEAWDHSLIGSQAAADSSLQRVAWDELIAGDAASLGAVYSFSYMVLLGFGYLVVSVLFVGGALPLYGGFDLKFNWERFWGNASKYFRPFVGLAIIAALLFLVANLASTLVDDMLADAMVDSNDEPSIFITNVLVTGGFRFLFFSLIVMIFQYAKVIAATEHLRNVVYLTMKAFSFVTRNFLRVLVLFLLLALLEFGINALDVGVWFFLLAGQDTWVLTAWLVFITTLLIIVKLSFLSCQLTFYCEMRRRVEETGAIRIGDSNYTTY